MRSIRREGKHAAIPARQAADWPAEATVAPDNRIVGNGVGHFLMVQRPTDINKRILEFLAR